MLNMSFTLPAPSVELERAVAHAASRGVISVAAAGNAATDALAYPAALPHVIGVGAVSPEGARSAFSSFGPALVTISAPGEGLVTTFPGGNYAGGWGTSYSTALVAGTATLMVALNPALTQATATASLSRTATPGADSGTRLVNVASAVADVAQQARSTLPVTGYLAEVATGHVFDTRLVRSHQERHPPVVTRSVLAPGGRPAWHATGHKAQGMVDATGNHSRWVLVALSRPLTSRGRPLSDGARSFEIPSRGLS